MFCVYGWGCHNGRELYVLPGRHGTDMHMHYWTRCGTTGYISSSGIVLYILCDFAIKHQMLFIIVLSWVVYVCIYSNQIIVEIILETTNQRVVKWEINGQTFWSTKLKHDNFGYIVLHQFYCLVNGVFIRAKIPSYGYRQLQALGRIMESKFD